ncbi:MAG: hypothetical protein IPJ03_08210 [Ignavibacteriales bacterium]|nr:hypothetical protein [Ignavibacteriales bacterium]
MKTIKIIIRSIPKIIRVIIGTIFIAPILGYIVIQIATDKTIELSTINILYLIFSVLILLIVGYVIGSFRAVQKLITQSNKSSSVLEKKQLPHRYISIGTFATRHLSSDIRANIFLNEKIKPSIDSFLDRVYEGEPFCTICLRPLDKWNASYMADFAQIGYKCPSCKTEIKGDWEDLRKSIKGDVRSKYAEYWEKYKKQIYELTNGNPDGYTLPKY